MGFFKRLFGASASSTERPSPARAIQSKVSNIQPKFEQEFGLRYVGNGWSYQGKGETFAELKDPKVVFLVLDKLRERDGFDQIVLVAGDPIAIACNSQPPMCIGTALKGDGIKDLTGALVKAGAEVIGEYKGAFLFHLPSSLSSRTRDPPSPTVAPIVSDPAKTTQDLDWLGFEYQQKCRVRAQSALAHDDELIARKLATLHQAYSRVCNLRTEEEEAECKRIRAETAELGRALCAAGGPGKMLLIAFRAEHHGARVSNIESFWNGICGWQA
jgi:hypothetical protein